MAISSAVPRPARRDEVFMVFAQAEGIFLIGTFGTRFEERSARRSAARSTRLVAADRRSLGRLGERCRRPVSDRYRSATNPRVSPFGLGNLPNHPCFNEIRGRMASACLLERTNCTAACWIFPSFWCQEFCKKMSEWTYLNRHRGESVNSSAISSTLIDAARRPVLRWIQIVFGIPVTGYIYSPFRELPNYAPVARYVAFPLIALSGPWMGKAHLIRRPVSRASA